MPDEKDPTIGSQSDDPNADQGQDTQLPDDPTDLKAALIESNRKAVQLQRQNERLEQDRKDEAEKVSYWKREADRKQAQERAQTAKPPEEKPREPEIDPLFEQDPFEMLSKEGGVQKFFETGRQKFGLLTKEEAEAVADDRARKILNEEREKDAREKGQYHHVAKTYPALQDLKSDMSIETAAEFEKVKEQFPEMSNAVATELAAGRAAAKLGYTPKVKAKENDGEADADRAARELAAGGETGRATRRGPVVVTEDVRKMARKTSGGDLDDAAIKRALGRVQANQASSRR